MYLAGQAGANPQLKNKFGLTPSDIAMDLDTRQVFESILSVNLES
jgi:hypothetical protein